VGLVFLGLAARSLPKFPCENAEKFQQVNDSDSTTTFKDSPSRIDEIVVVAKQE
jgi:hypothetical protein